MIFTVTGPPEFLDDEAIIYYITKLELVWANKGDPLKCYVCLSNEGADIISARRSSKWGIDVKVYSPASISEAINTLNTEKVGVVLTFSDGENHTLGKTIASGIKLDHYYYEVIIGNGSFKNWKRHKRFIKAARSADRATKPRDRFSLR